MSENKAQKAYLNLQEQTAETYKTFQQEFEQKISSSESAEEGSRIQLLEQMIRRMNSDIIRENLKYVGKMIESLDEDSFIESKKTSS